jgi:cytochrome P450
VLSILIEAHDEDGVGLTDDELVGHVSVLFIAGHETSAFTLAWTLFLLAQHPRANADLEAELRSALRGDAPTAESLARLPLLDAVVRESMRLLPPTPFLFVRRGTSAFSLGPYSLPAGAQVILSPLVTHRARSIYTEPKRFLPGRWDTISPGPYEYMPFGAGPRFCVGAAFGAQLVRITLAVLVQRFRFTLLLDARIARKAQGITMGPRYGMPMRVARHDGQLAPPSRVQGDIHELVDLPGG